MPSNGVPHRLDIALSRDQEFDSQSRGAKRDDRLWSWLQDGAPFYVGGDGGAWLGLARPFARWCR